MAPTIHFATVVGGQNVYLLPRLIRHYTFLGVTGRWLVHVHMQAPDDPILAEVERQLSPFDVEIAGTAVGPWRHRMNPGLLSRARALYPKDWCVIADQDEFQIYPDELSRLVEHCEQRGFNCVRGHFVDRVGANGALPEIAPTGSLWDLFPLGGHLTEGVLAGFEPKIVLARGDALVGWGNHDCQRGNPCPAEELDVPVHHFKWDASVVNRLESRYGLYTTYGEMAAEESFAFLQHVREFGRINVHDRRLQFRWIGNPYGSENRLD